MVNPAGVKSSEIGLEAALAAELEALGADETTELSALCISGGGIRSATFGLGCLQGLAEAGLLRQFDYLSTVSGGGYIGSWLTAWIARAKGIDNVIPRLHRDAPQLQNQPDPIEHLREYNRYLAPKSGLLSTDLWTLSAAVLRNIILNWLVMVPLLMAALMVPRLYLSLLAIPTRICRVPAPECWKHSFPIFDVVSLSPWVLWILPLTSLVLFTAALFNTLRFLPGIGGNDHSLAQHGVFILAPLVSAVFTYLLYDTISTVGSNYIQYSNLVDVSIWTSVPCLVAWSAYLLWDRRPIRQRLRLLFSPLSLAVVSLAIGTAISLWATVNFLLWDVETERAPSWIYHVTVGLPAILLGICAGLVLFVGMSSSFLKDEDREWLSRTTAGVMMVAVIWFSASVVVLVLPSILLNGSYWQHAAIFTAAAGSAWLTSSSGTIPSDLSDPPSRQAQLFVLAQARRLAPLAFIALLTGALSVLTDFILQEVSILLHATAGDPDRELLLAFADPNAQSQLIDQLFNRPSLMKFDHELILEMTDPWTVLGVATALAALGWVMSYFVNTNTFSLHGMYRDRLVRAYLGASNPDRTVSRFTSFCNTDDMPMGKIDPRQRPLHVLNLTLNLVAGTRLAWQQRKAASFTVTPLHSGSANLGYRPSSAYAGGISLGTAMALSGAAVSPNMGYNSSAIAGVIMTLFNARLGAWLGNPGPRGAATWELPGPGSAVPSLVREALEQTDEQCPFVYLSDGGHFDNLGVYEMIRRRCKIIVVLDAASDPEFICNDLGNALRKIRIDFQVEIKFDESELLQVRQNKRRCAVATIRYAPDAGRDREGRLVYIKPLLRGTEPPDVQSYAAAHSSFPHESSSNQLFDESQTESYRQLGLLTLSEMCEQWNGDKLSEWIGHVSSAASSDADSEQ